MLSRLLYYLVLWPVSRLPFALLYAVSDFFFVLLYYLIPYRHKVVKANLRASFPEMGEAEINKICKEFYRHLCDLIIESLKGFSISEAQLNKRIHMINPELMQQFAHAGKSVILIASHYGNWEWPAMIYGKHTGMKPAGIYQPLKDIYLNNKLKFSRSRFGTILVPVKEVDSYFKTHINDITAYGFASDQTPSNPQRCVWTLFLNQETPVLFGAEKYAKEYDLPVVYARVQKIKRGYYNVLFEVITDNPNELAYGEITRKHVALLEHAIRQQPAYWLWSHRRWKHRRPQNQPLIV